MNNNDRKNTQSPNDMEDRMMLTCEAFKPNLLDNMTNVGYGLIRQNKFDFEDLRNKHSDNIFGELDNAVKNSVSYKHKVPKDARPELWFRNKKHIYEAANDPGPMHN